MKYYNIYIFTTVDKLKQLECSPTADEPPAHETETVHTVEHYSIIKNEVLINFTTLISRTMYEVKRSHKSYTNLIPPIWHVHSGNSERQEVDWWFSVQARPRKQLLINEWLSSKVTEVW